MNRINSLIHIFVYWRWHHKCICNLIDTRKTKLWTAKVPFHLFTFAFDLMSGTQQDGWDAWRREWEAQKKAAEERIWQMALNWYLLHPALCLFTLPTLPFTYPRAHRNRSYATLNWKWGNLLNATDNTVNPLYMNITGWQHFSCLDKKRKWNVTWVSVFLLCLCVLHLHISTFILPSIKLAFIQFYRFHMRMPILASSIIDEK